MRDPLDMSLGLHPVQKARPWAAGLCQQRGQISVDKGPSLELAHGRLLSGR
jgi:hypothetical protein